METETTLDQDNRVICPLCLRVLKSPHSAYGLRGGVLPAHHDWSPYAQAKWCDATAEGESLWGVWLSRVAAHMGKTPEAAIATLEAMPFDERAELVEAVYLDG